jgi:hypothetical protein
MSFSVNFAGIDTPNVREYIAGVVKWGVSAPGVGIRGALGKANSYPSRAEKEILILYIVVAILVLIIVNSSNVG